MQEKLYQRGDAGVSASDSEFRRHSIRQEMQVSFYQTANTGDTLRLRMQESLYQTADSIDKGKMR